MTKRTRTTRTGGFKAAVALEAITSGMDIAALAEKHAVHPALVRYWRRVAEAAIEAAFNGHTNGRATEGVPPVGWKEANDMLLTKIGQLVMEREAHWHNAPLIDPPTTPVAVAIARKTSASRGPKSAVAKPRPRSAKPRSKRPPPS